MSERERESVYVRSELPIVKVKSPTSPCSRVVYRLSSGWESVILDMAAGRNEAVGAGLSKRTGCTSEPQSCAANTYEEREEKIICLRNRSELE